MKRIHIFKQGLPNHPVLLLLHGTGGDENQLIDLALQIDNTASLLSLRGEVNENGLTRHFKRIGPLTFDQLDLNRRTDDLDKFLSWASLHYGFDRYNVIGIGYSNGANILSSYLFHFPKLIKGAILFAPMSGGTIEHRPDLFQLPIFIGAGYNDTICPQEMTLDLENKFKTSGADVSIFWHNSGHSITTEELQSAHAWYLRHFDK